MAQGDTFPWRRTPCPQEHPEYAGERERAYSLIAFSALRCSKETVANSLSVWRCTVAYNDKRSPL